MYAIIYDTHGNEQARFTLHDDDILDCDIYAKMYGDSIGYDVERNDYGHCWVAQDFEVCLQEVPGSPIQWASQAYIINFED